jgi:hypothetical protein
MRLDRVLQRRWVCANDLADLLTILEQHECRHGAHAQLLRNLWDFVDVEFVEASVGVLVRESVGSLCQRRHGFGRYRSITHLTTCGAMTLQGPHHVAKQSRTISVPFSSMAESNSALDLRLWTPSLDILEVVVKVLAVGRMVFM